MRLLIFFGNQNANIPSIRQAMANSSVSNIVELLDGLPLHVHFASLTDNLQQPSALNLRLDDFGRESYARKQHAEFPRRLRKLSLLLEDVLLDRADHRQPRGRGSGAGLLCGSGF